MKKQEMAGHNERFRECGWHALEYENKMPQHVQSGQQK